MTASERKDLHDAIFLELSPPVYPRGRSSAFLTRRVHDLVECTEQEVLVELLYFMGEGFVERVLPDRHNPDLPVVWALSSAGLREARARGFARG